MSPPAPYAMPCMQERRYSLFRFGRLLPLLLGTCQIFLTVGCETKPAASGSAGAALATGVQEIDGAQILYRPDGVAEVSFDALKFDFRPDGAFEMSDLTDEIRDLAGKKIIVRGYILNSVYKSQFSEFVLIRDNQQCCFGPGAKLFHNMQIEMADQQFVQFTTRPVTVEGTFSLSPYIAPDKKCYSVFKCVATRVQK